MSIPHGVWRRFLSTAYFYTCILKMPPVQRAFTHYIFMHEIYVYNIKHKVTRIVIFTTITHIKEDDQTHQWNSKFDQKQPAKTAESPTKGRSQLEQTTPIIAGPPIQQIKKHTHK